MQAMTREEWAKIWPLLKANEKVIEAFIRGEEVVHNGIKYQKMTFIEPHSCYTIVPPKRILKYQPYLRRFENGRTTVETWDDGPMCIPRDGIVRLPGFIKWLDELRQVEI